ncbi:Carboxypeptidase B [Durusdinium trenchii]|uniref:Carboxypeptidase B n=1 Tax=Durusdinium trenchii TaxID=1381693 RepID=A0ABP0Q798_9DINO
MAGARRLFAGTPWIGNDCYFPSQTARPPPIPWSGEMAQFFQDYRTLDDINRYLDLLAQRHPKLVTVREIGHSWEGRPLRVLEITKDGNSAEKPCIFLEGGIHSREWIATSTVLYIAGSLLREAEKSDVQLLLKHFVFTLLVPVNPDGYVYTWEVDRMWRKTRSDRPNLQCDGKVAGVDANRNWGFTFGKTADKSYESLLHDPCSSVFIGPKPFSEPETKAASDYMKQRQEKSLQLKSETAGPGYVAAFIDYHSYAEAMLPPWAYTAETPSGPDGVYQTEMTKSLNRAFFNTSGRTFHAGADVFPPDPGTGPDWAYGLLGIRATMTIELEGHSFCLPATQIQNVGQEQWAGVKALASFIQKHGGEPSTETGLFAPGGNSLLVAANPSMEAPASYGWLIALTVGGVIVVAVAGLMGARSWLRTSRGRSYAADGIELE